MADSENERKPKAQDRGSGMTPDELKESLDELARNVDELVDRLTMDMADAPVGTTPVRTPEEAGAAPPVSAARTEKPASTAPPPKEAPQPSKSDPAVPSSPRADEVEIDLDAMTDRMIDSVTTEGASTVEAPAKSPSSAQAAVPPARPEQVAAAPRAGVSPSKPADSKAPTPTPAPALGEAGATPGRRPAREFSPKPPVPRAGKPALAKSTPAAAGPVPSKPAATGKKQKAKTGGTGPAVPGVPGRAQKAASGSRRGGRAWRWLAAAAVLGFIAVGAWLVLSPDGPVPWRTRVAQGAPGPGDDPATAGPRRDFTFPASASLFDNEPNRHVGGGEPSVTQDPANALEPEGPVPGSEPTDQSAAAASSTDETPTPRAPEATAGRTAAERSGATVKKPEAAPVEKPTATSTTKRTAAPVKKPETTSTTKPAPAATGSAETAATRKPTATEKPAPVPPKPESPAVQAPKPAPAKRSKPEPVRRSEPLDADTKWAAAGAQEHPPSVTAAPPTVEQTKATPTGSEPERTTNAGSPAVATTAATAPPSEPADSPVQTRPTTPSATPTDTAPVGTTGPTPVEDSFRPPEVVTRQEPVYPARARKRGEGGVVELKVLVNEQGRVVRVMVVSGLPGSELEARAIDAALRSTYRPATEGGKPVRAWATERFVFEP